MKITKVKETPRKIREFPVENELGLSEQQVEDVAEIFQTPLTAVSYTHLTLPTIYSV